jgi:23S rRNA pseudouridine2605 synthase
MRINRYISSCTGIGRRQADKLIDAGRVLINGEVASLGNQVENKDKVTLDGEQITLTSSFTTIMLNKPRRFVVSRTGQGNNTIYDLLPKNYSRLKAVGRLDKNSSGLLLLTDDGQLAQELTHPKYRKTKIYRVKLDKQISESDLKLITGTGVLLEDGLSKLSINKEDKTLIISMSEGRNRQIRRTFLALGYKVLSLKRTNFGNYELNDLEEGKYKQV